MDEFLILLQAKLDEAASKGLINSDISSLQDKLDKLKLQATLDPNTAQKLANDIGKLINQKITISNINIDTGQTVKNAQQTGQQIGNALNQGISKEVSKSQTAIENFKKSLSNAGKSSSEINNLIEKVKSLNVQIEALRFSESSNGFMNIDVSGLDNLNNKVKITQSLIQDLQTKEWSVTNTNTSIISTKELDKINKVFADYTAKLAQFKSTNSEILSGLSVPVADFETKLSGLKNGTATIDEVVNSFKSLNTEASNITANFSRQLSPIDSAIRNLAKGEETIAGLRAEIKGLNNAPKEINTELNKCSSLLAKVKQIESENGRTSQWSQAYKEWANSVDALKAKLTTLRKEQSNVASTQVFKIGDLKNNDIAYMSKVYNTIEKQMTEINKMANAKGWNIVDISGVEQSDGKIKQLTLTVKDAEGALKRLTMQREKLQGNGKAQFGLMQVGDIKVIETASQAQEKLAQSVAKANAKLSEQSNKIQLSIETGGYESKVESLIARTRQWTDSEGQARINTAALSDALTKLTQASEAYANNKSEATQKRLIESSKKLDAEYQKITNNVRKMNAEMAKDSAISSLHNQVNEFMSKNGKAVKYSGEFMRIFNETAQGAKLTREEIAKLNQEFNNAVVQARNAGKLGKTFFQTLREGMSLFSYWTSSTFLVMKAIQSVKGGLGTVKALDTALVDLKKTTTMTNNELEDFYYSSNKVAKRMGVTTEEILKQAAAWSRLGYSSAEQATKMAQLSSQFASISPGMSTDEAQEGLVSIIKAWGLDVDEVEREVMDNINHLGNRFAESNIDLVNGMKRSAAALAATGTTYQDAFALFTGAQEVVQNAEVTGRALRSISMRMHGYSENSEDGLMEVDEELKNITGDLIDLTKTAEHSQGVSIFKEGSSTEFKSLVEYFGEINKIWDEMSQVQQNSFLDKAFGKNQAQAGAAIVQNYEAIAEAIKVMEDAAGSSDREMSIIMDSLDYKLNRLSETGTSVAQNLFKRDDMATVVDGLTSVMSVIDSLTSKLGLFGSIGLGAGLFAGVKNIGKTCECMNFKSSVLCFEYALHA